MIERSISKFPKQLSLLLGTGNDVVVGLRAVQSRNCGSISGRNKRFSSLHKVQTVSGVYLASSSMGTSVLA